MSAVIDQMVILFITIALGYLLGKLKILDEAGTKYLTKIVVNVSLPCTILNSVLDKSAELGNGEVFLSLGLCSLGILISFAISYVIPSVLRAKREDFGIYRFLGTFGNNGFMGYPVILSVLGSGGAIFVTMLQIPTNLITYSIGMKLLAGRDSKPSLKRMLINVPMIFSVLALVIYVARFQLPDIAYSATAMIGNITTPGAMLVIGSTLAELPVKSIFGKWRIYIVCIVRLALIPIVIYFVLSLFTDNQMMIKALTILFGMPTASVATMLSVEFGGNDKLAANGVFLTTLASLITIPVMSWLLLG